MGHLALVRTPLVHGARVHLAADLGRRHRPLPAIVHHVRGQVPTADVVHLRRALHLAVIAIVRQGKQKLTVHSIVVSTIAVTEPVKLRKMRPIAVIVLRFAEMVSAQVARFVMDVLPIAGPVRRHRINFYLLGNDRCFIF